MQIGIFSTTTSNGHSTIDEIIADVQTAEAQGFHTYWSSQVFSHDALTLFGIVARETDRIEMGTSVVPTYPRHPAMLAAQALTVQKVAGGRFTLGIGLSHKPVIEGMFGLSFDKPLRHMRDYLEILMPLVDGAPASYRGESLSAQVVLDFPNTTPVPVLVAALGPRMLELAAARTSGTTLWMTGPKTIAEHVAPTITAAAIEAGNPAPRIAAGLPVCVTSDPDAARARAAQIFAIYGQLPSYRAMLDREGMSGPEDLAIIGDEEAVAARIRDVAHAGATDFAAAEFGHGDEEQTRTRDLLRSLL